MEENSNFLKLEPERTNRKLILFFGVLVFVVAATVFIVFFNKQNSAIPEGFIKTEHGFYISEKVSEKGPLPLKQGLLEEGWTEYSNTDFAYRLLYPPDWFIVEGAVYLDRTELLSVQLKSLIQNCGLECAALQTTVIENISYKPCSSQQSCVFPSPYGAAMIITVLPNVQHMLLQPYLTQVFGGNDYDSVIQLQNGGELIYKEIQEKSGTRSIWYVTDQAKESVFILDSVIRPDTVSRADPQLSYASLASIVEIMSSTFETR